jgi:hypothetical protein
MGMGAPRSVPMRRLSEDQDEYDDAEHEVGIEDMPHEAETVHD